MSRSSWNVYIQDSGSTWVSDGSIYRPNDDLTIGRVSTQYQKTLHDGSLVYVLPSTKFHKESLEFIWLHLPRANYLSFINKINDYIENGTYLKIIDHNSDEYIGRFINAKRIWITGLKDTYDLKAIFMIME